MDIKSLNIRSATLKVLVGTLVAVIIIFAGSFVYYSNLNSAEDPRVLEAKHLQLTYEKKLESDQYGEAMILLNRMKDIYESVSGYANTPEIGVIYNNQASVYLVKLETDLLTLEENQIDREDMLISLNMARKLTEDAIGLYELWLKETGKLSESEIRTKITPFFNPDDKAFTGFNLSKIFEKRVEDIVAAQVETVRRLSVSYTNLGVINRYSGQLEEAKSDYEKAINLWDRNYAAVDNLNTLMNLPREKRSMIDRLFPPERLTELQ